MHTSFFQRLFDATKLLCAAMWKQQVQICEPQIISQKKPLIVIVGCTGTGKSNLGIAIAKRFGGEVINADSMQIYKGKRVQIIWIYDRFKL